MDAMRKMVSRPKGRLSVYHKKNEWLSSSREGAFVDIQTLRMKADPRRPFGRYYSTNLYELLGSGGFGEVYKTTSKATGAECAVKVTFKDRVQEGEFVYNELESLLELDHPNISKLYDVFEDDMCVYLVTELASGGDLNVLVNQVGAEGYLDEVVRVFLQLMEAVAYCHGRGVCHRDLKVENCLLSDSEQRNLKIIDFGLAAIKKPTDTNLCLQEALGTPFYMSPEVTDRRETYGIKCDVWSAGIILYMLLTGEHPFFTPECIGDLPRLFWRVRTLPPAQEPLASLDVPEPACELVCSMLRRDPAERPSAHEILKHPWIRRVSLPSIRLSRPSSIRRRFNHFGKISHFEKAILTLVAHQAQESELADVRQVFKALDSDGDGMLSAGEIEDAFLQCGLTSAHEEVLHIFDSFDHKGLGKVQYTAWLAATMQPDVIASERAVAAAFHFFDTEGEGAISKEELLTVLDEADAQDVIECWDTSGDGTLNPEDFRLLMADLARRRGYCEVTPSPSGESPVSPKASGTSMHSSLESSRSPKGTVAPKMLLRNRLLSF